MKRKNASTPINVTV